VSETAASTQEGGVRRAFLRFKGIQEIGVLIALILICVVISMKTELFLQQSNLLKVARQSSYIGIMAVGMVFVISMGDIDLSVGSILLLSNVVAALALANGYSITTAVLISLASGAVCGLLNGVLAVTLRIPMIIVTLGTLSVYRGLALMMCNNAPVSNFTKQGFFFDVLGGDVLGVPASVWTMLIVAVLGWLCITRSVFGRQVQAIGGNAAASRLSGIPIPRRRIAVMTLNGLIAALSGIMALAFLQSADPTIGKGFELWVIASVIIGGTALAGGYGSVPGAILGTLIIYVIQDGLTLTEARPNMDVVVTGAAIIVAVAVDALVRRRAQVRT
jgi:ribose/xylose/arabinose/galactoside ABC-type transport system permease subunit